MSKVMTWKGRELKTYSDLMNYGIDACESKEEARAFIRAYLLHNIHARANIGYLLGYYSKEKQEKYYDWFDVIHPLFGTEKLDSSEVYQLGYAIAEAHKKNESNNNPWFVGALLKNVSNEEI